MAITGADPNGPWAERTSDELGERARTTTEYELLPPAEPTYVRFTGTCPACTHEFLFDWPLESLRVAHAADPVVLCQCSAPTHAGRPSGTSSGCGAYWVSGIAP